MAASNAGRNQESLMQEAVIIFFMFLWAMGMFGLGYWVGSMHD